MLSRLPRLPRREPVDPPLVFSPPRTIDGKTVFAVAELRPGGPAPVGLLTIDRQGSAFRPAGLGPLRPLAVALPVIAAVGLFWLLRRDAR